MRSRPVSTQSSGISMIWKRRTRLRNKISKSFVWMPLKFSDENSLWAKRGRKLMQVFPSMTFVIWITHLMIWRLEHSESSVWTSFNQRTECHNNQHVNTFSRYFEQYSTTATAAEKITFRNNEHPRRTGSIQH